MHPRRSTNYTTLYTFGLSTKEDWRVDEREWKSIFSDHLTERDRIWCIKSVEYESFSFPSYHHVVSPPQNSLLPIFLHLPPPLRFTSLRIFKPSRQNTCLLQSYAISDEDNVITAAWLTRKNPASQREVGLPGPYHCTVGLHAQPGQERQTVPLQNLWSAHHDHTRPLH